MAGNVTNSQGTPTGHGHNYGGQLDGWVAVAAPAGWTVEDTGTGPRELKELTQPVAPEFQ